MTFFFCSAIIGIIYLLIKAYKDIKYIYSKKNSICSNINCQYKMDKWDIIYYNYKIKWDPPNKCNICFNKFSNDDYNIIKPVIGDTCSIWRDDYPKKYNRGGGYFQNGWTIYYVHWNYEGCMVEHNYYKCEKVYRPIIALNRESKSYILHCGHRFHVNCLHKWEKTLNNRSLNEITKYTCPICRKEYDKPFKRPNKGWRYYDKYPWSINTFLGYHFHPLNNEYLNRLNDISINIRIEMIKNCIVLLNVV